MPLSILVALGVLKEGLADYKRYKIDRETNAAPALRLTGRLNGQLDKTGCIEKTRVTKVSIEQTMNMFEVEECTTE